jgi:hypothetical protein
MTTLQTTDDQQRVAPRMSGREALRVVRQLADHSDLGRRGRPGIKGTQKHLDAEVQMLMSGGDAWMRAHAAATLIEAKVREAYGIPA